MREKLRKDGHCSFTSQSGKGYGSLVFTHALVGRYSRMPWKEQEVIGEYVLTYGSGKVERISISGGCQVGYIKARPGEPLSSPLYRHNGYSASYECDSELISSSCGDWCTYYRYEHLLAPEDELTSVVWEQRADACRLLVAYVEGITRKEE